MVCNNCGVEINHEGQFCSNCGQRIDGKVMCPSCKKLIDKKAIYCNFCGQRVDGKKVCSNCGKEIDGDFCSFCGSRSSEKSRQKFNIFSIVSSSVLLFSIFLMFGLLFTIGTKSIAVMNGEILSETNNGFSYYLFGVYRNLKDPKFIDLLPNILATIAIAGSLIVSFIMSIIATIKFVGAMLNKKAISISSNYLATFICYTVALIFVYMCLQYNIEHGVIYSSNQMLSFWAVFAFIASILLFVVSIIMDLISREKKELSVKLIIKLILGMIASILVVVSFFTTYSKNFVVTYLGSETINDIVNYTVISSFGIRDFVQNLGDIAILKEIWSKYTLSSVYTANYLTNVALQILFVITLLFLLKNIFNKENRYGVAIALSSLTFIFSITCLVLSIIAKNDLTKIMGIVYEGEYVVDVYIKGAITSVVLSLLTLVSTISCQVISNLKKEIINT